MPVIVVANQKGGVGKTTTTLNLGAGLQEQGKRVLLVDLDPQANLTVAAGLAEPGSLSPTIGELLAATTRTKKGVGALAQKAIVRSPSGLDLIPSNAQLSAAELALVSALSRELALRQVLESVVESYDYVLIDCLPSLGLVAINALTAADGLVVPVQADFLAMQGVAQIIETVAAVQERLNPSLQVYGLLLTMIDSRTVHAREVVSVIRQTFDGKLRVFDNEIRLHVVLKDSTKAGQTILAYDSESPGAQSYRGLAAEVLAITEALPQKAAAAPGPSVVTVAAAAATVPPPVTGAPQAHQAPDSVAAAQVTAAPGPTAPSLEPTQMVAAEAPAAPSQPAVPAPTQAESVAEQPTPAAPVAPLPAPVPSAAPPVAQEQPRSAPVLEKLRFSDFLVGREVWLANESG